MIPLRKIEIDDEVVGTIHAGPRHFTMLGTVDNITHEVVIVDGNRSPGRTHYLVQWADGSRTLCREHQLRHVSIPEEAFGLACALEIISRAQNGSKA